ncbi:MAG: LamG domain-containing protein [Prevotellaceae bacterium]|nr:LamG domain-containing protein [Prevotellaceae bacterium]
MTKKCLLFALFAMFSGLVLFSCKDKNDPDGGNKIDPSTIAEANLVAYFPFDSDGSDKKGHSVTPKNVNASDFVKGQRGNAYKGKKGSGFIYSLPANDPIAKAKGITFAMWLNSPAPVAGSPVLCQLNGTTGDWDMPGSFTLQFQDAEQLIDTVGFKLFQFNMTTEWKGQWSGLFSSKFFPANKWFHFVAMYDESTSTYKAYANGNLVWKEVRYSGPDPENGSPQPLLGGMSLPGDVNKLYIGAWWKLLEGQDADEWAQYFVGMLDELRIYNKGLTDNEVKALFDAEVSQLND